MKTSDLYLLMAAALAATFAAWWVNRDALAAMQSQSADAAPGDTGLTFTDTLTSIMETVADPIRQALGMWAPPAIYAALIANTEDSYSIPRDILARLLYQESHYRADIISGAKTSSAGALGIAQFMPQTAADLGINPLDPAQAIDAAGRYLAAQYRTFGNWSEALAAYNWGGGNVSRKGLQNAPAETVAYYSQILADVNNATGQNLA